MFNAVQGLPDPLGSAVVVLEFVVLTTVPDRPCALIEAAPGSRTARIHRCVAAPDTSERLWNLGILAK